MFRAWFLTLLSVLTVAHADEVNEAPADAAVPDIEDITDQMREWNSDASPQPPRNFRSGHVSPAKISKHAIKTEARGFKVQLPGYSRVVTPAVHNGKVIASGGFSSQQIFAFNARTGDFEWGVNLDDDGPSTIACEGETCVFNTESCTIFALNSETGAHKWSLWMGDPMMSAPSIARGRVFTAYPAHGNRPHRDASHALAALDLETGEILWQRWLDADIMSAPVATDGELYVTTFNGTLMKLDQKTGTILSAVKARATSAPIIVGSEVYYTRRSETSGSARESVAAAGRGDAKLMRQVATKDAPYLDASVQQRSAMASEGKVLDAGNGFGGGAPASAAAHKALATVGQGSVSTLQGYQGSRILNVGGTNINTMGDEVVATVARTGERLWTHELPGNMRHAGGFLAAPPIVAGGWVFVATLQGEVQMLDPTDGRLVKSYDIGSALRSQPVIENGMIYVGTENGILVGIDTGDPELTGWPMWGKDAARTGSVAS